MKNKLFAFLFMLCLIPISASAGLTSIYTVWVESANAGAPEVGTTVFVEQGDPVHLYYSISTFTNTIGYRVKVTQTDQLLIPHTIIQGGACGGGSGCSYATYDTFDTTAMPVGNYRVEVSANDDGINGQYDETIFLYLNVQEAQDQNEAPNAPTNPNPNNGATNINLNPTLSWTGSDPDGDTLTYDVYFGTNPSPTNRVANDISQNSYQVTTPNYETTYYWKVVANDGEFETSSNTWSFTTKEEDIPENHGPNDITNLSPINGATNININPTFSWFGDDPDGDELLFTVYLSTETPLGPEHIVSENQTEMTYQPSTLNYNTVYYWGVLARDPSGLYRTSATLSFTTIPEPETNEAPNAPTNPNPANGTTSIDLLPIISWTGSDPDGDTLTYDVYFGTNPSPTNRVAQDIENNYYQLNSLDYNTIYYWKIIAKDSEFETSSNVWHFTTVGEGQPQNHYPEIEEISNKRARCRAEFNFQVNASDEDDDNLMYYDNTNLFDIDSETGLISFTPLCNDRGTYNIQITVIDEHGASAIEIFQLEIYRASSSGGGSGNNDDEEEVEETEIIIKEGLCIDDHNGDKFGIRNIITKEVDLLTRQVLSFETNEESCLLKTKKISVPAIYDYKSNECIIALVALLFLLILIPVVMYAYRKYF